MIPEYWTQFMTLHNIEGKEYELSEARDLSGVGAIIEILCQDDIKIEATEYWPGIGVLNDGYVPIGHCAVGTGDPYFINVHDGANGKLYRICHDMVTASGYNASEAIAVVLSQYEDLLRYECS